MLLPWWLLLSATISTTEGPTTSTRQSKSCFYTFCAGWKFCISCLVILFLNCCPAGACIPWLNFTAPPSWRGTIWSSARRSWAKRYDKGLHKVKKICMYNTWIAHFDLFALSLAESEHLLQPPEAPVWARAALVWCLHHRHWPGPLFQVGSHKYCTQTVRQS